MLTSSVGEADEDRSLVIQRCRAVAEDGMAVLHIAMQSGATRLSEQAVYTLIAFSDQSQPWVSTAAVSSSAAALLDSELSGRDRDEFIVEQVLKGYLRSLFAKSRPATVTASGRKAAFVRDRDGVDGLELENRRGKPWKYEDFRAILVFTWAVHGSDVGLPPVYGRFLISFYSY